MSDPTTPPPSPSPSPSPSPTPPPIDYGVTPPAGLFTAPPVPATKETDANAKTWGMIAHLSALAGYVIPFGNAIGPLVVWQTKKLEIPFAADQAKEALNFHITVLIAVVISLALMCIVIGFFILPVVGITALVFTIIGGMKANSGEYYRYPFALRLIK